MPYRKPASDVLPDNVIETESGFWVRIERDGEIYQQSFAQRLFGTRERTLEEAVRWRDEILANLPELFYPGGQLRKAAMPTKASDLPAGVSRYWSTRRKPTHSRYLIYAVSFREGDKQRIKRFSAGAEGRVIAEMEQRARAAACAFRAEYVECALEGRVFDRSARQTPAFMPGKDSAFAAGEHGGCAFAVS